MEAIQVLKDEHRVIEQVLDCLEVMAGRCESEGRLEADAARSAIDFFRVFADTCHHGKEEAHLFEMMASRGFSKELGPVAVMLVEHEQGRARIRGMSEAVDGAANGEPAACRAFVENARAYLVLLREHIQKEDDCLFPMAAQALGDADQAALAEAFERVERDELGPETHGRYLRIADELADRFGVARNRLAPDRRHQDCGQTP